MKKIVFVVQRYGIEVNGGAELQCRVYAEHMTKYYEVEVLTTKAIDYSTWKDEYEADIETINGVTVRRFPVRKPRDPKKFHVPTGEILAGTLTKKKEEQWMRDQGPECPKLVDYIREHEAEYDVFLFNTYLYYITYFGMQAVQDKRKVILIPTAHDETPIYLKLFQEMFTWPGGIFYHTVQEKAFVEQKFGVAKTANNGGHGGVGIDLPEETVGERFKQKYSLEDYILYVGRVEIHKGCVELAKYFQEYKARNPEKKNLKLVYLGKEVCELPKDPNIISLGFVSEQDKYDALAGCKALVLPSQFESLSIVVLEAMAMQKPVLIHGNCEVVKSHVDISNGGLYYTNYFEFEGTLNYLLDHPVEAEQMGVNGKAYVDKYYAWDAIEKQLCDLIENVQ